MILHQTHDVIERDAYRASLDEFRGDDGQQMLVMHIDVDASRFSPAVMKQMLDEWSALRACIPVPIFGWEPEPDDEKWERFVSLLGFQNTHSRIPCTDGQSRRVFVSFAAKDVPDALKEHADRAD